MTDRTPNRDQVAPRDAETARLAVEALFETRAISNETSPDVEVTVKRRRSVSADGAVHGDASGSGEVAAARAPRVFKIEKQQESDENERSRRRDAASALDRDEATSPASDLTKPARRRRRRLNGEVTIIRPQVALPHAARRESIGTRPAREVAALQQEEAGEFDTFGSDPAVQLRYQNLMERIGVLERQALVARKREAAIATRWIKKAIRDYGIGPRELGFENLAARVRHMACGAEATQSLSRSDGSG